MFGYVRTKRLLEPQSSKSRVPSFIIRGPFCELLGKTMLNARLMELDPLFSPIRSETRSRRHPLTARARDASRTSGQRTGERTGPRARPRGDGCLLPQVVSGMVWSRARPQESCEEHMPLAFVLTTIIASLLMVQASTLAQSSADTTARA